jgi:YHS domain-containing protein
VRDEVAKLNNSSLSREQQLSKISWKTVATNLASSGGSYHFGNATCKKKFVDIDPYREY